MEILPLVAAILLISPTEACIATVKEKDWEDFRMYGPWTELPSKRVTVENCECGQQYSNGSLPWNLYIHMKRPGSSICTATIITSNLIATSHECITIPGMRPNVYEAFSPDNYQSFEKPKDIVVSTSAIKSEGENFTVGEILISSRYVMDLLQHRYLDNDMLLLRLNTDFTKHPTLGPICIPEDADDVDFVKQTGYYYGNVFLAKTAPKKAPSMPLIHQGQILTKSICKESEQTGLLNLADYKKVQETLCLRWVNHLYFPVASHKGGPLIIKSHLHEVSFLAGIACDTNSSSIKGEWSYVYFTNIYVLIKYIEYEAGRHDSKWCKTPKLELVGKADVIEKRIAPWPWEEDDVVAGLMERNESPDCVCGVANPDIGGRIVGGSEATAYEYGWMASLELSNDNGEIGYCGGTIINDRMILTAAHCVISEEEVRLGNATMGSKPERIKLRINIHSLPEDKIAIQKEVQRIIFHPEFVTSRKHDYTDFDIAIIELKELIKFAPNMEKGVRPICLPKLGENIDVVGKTAMAAGWGLVNPNDPDSIAKKLQKIELPIVDLQRCRDLASEVVTNHFICAGTFNKYKDTAPGDSGGPLTIRRGSQWLQVGLVSWADEPETDNPKEQRTIAFYTDITDKMVLPFIDYFAKRSGATFCRSDT